MGIEGLFEAVCGIILGLLKLLYWYVEALYRQIVPPPMKSVDGETILVTGAVGGIGKEICRHIVQSGRDIKLVLWDLNETSLAKFAGELRVTGRRTGLKVFHFAVDISSRENIEKCCEKAKDTVGPVSIIFNNAGVAAHGNFLLLSNEQIESTIQVNLMSQFWIIRQFLPGMVSRNHGRIVNVCSVAGLKAAQNSFPYVASKFAVNGYSEALRMELDMFQNDGVHVTTVYPFFVRTPMIKTLEVSKNHNIRFGSLLPTFLEPEDVGREIVDGMRREKQHVYLPSSLPLILLVDYFLPMKARRAFQSIFIKYVSYGDPKEQTALFTSFSQVVSNNGNGELQ